MSDWSVCGWRKWRQLKCSVFTQYRNREPIAAASSQSDFRRQSIPATKSKFGWCQQVLFLQSWEKTERLNTLIACTHAHMRNACVSLQMRMRRYVVTARYSDHIWGSPVPQPGSASDSLATLSASFDNSSCVPWKKKQLVPKLICADAFKKKSIVKS